LMDSDQCSIAGDGAEVQVDLGVHGFLFHVRKRKQKRTPPSVPLANLALVAHRLEDGYR
jgi:hypothetical protein